MAPRKTPPRLEVISSTSKTSPDKPKGKVGQPPHQPTDATRTLVTLGKAAGMNDDALAKLVGISVPTLLKHYGKELETGVQELTAKIAGTLAKIALNPTHPKAVTAAIFWLKAKGGWSDGHGRGAASGDDDADDDADDGPVEFTIAIGDKRGS